MKGVRKIISTSQRRQNIRVGTNLVAKLSAKKNSELIERIVYIQDISVSGAKIISRERIDDIGSILNLEFKYKNILYNVLCKIVRSDDEDTSLYGVQFYFKGDDSRDISTNNNLNCNRNKLYNDILKEFFDYKAY